MPVTILETIYKDKAFTNQRINTFIGLSVSYFAFLRYFFALNARRFPVSWVKCSVFRKG
jgi:hypothetical protein